MTTGANTVLGSVAGGAVAEITCTSAGRAILDDAAASDQRTTLGLGTIATQDATAVSASHDVAYLNNDALTYSATTTIDLSSSAKTTQTVSLTGSVTFATSNRASGRTKFLRIISDGSTRAFTFPSWVFVGGSAPASIAASKTATLSLMCFGTAETDVVACYIVQT